MSLNRQTERTLSSRAVELGNSADAAALPELVTLLDSPYKGVRRLAVSAIGKLAGTAEASTAVEALLPLLQDTAPQVRQYTIRALRAYGVAAKAR